MQRIALPDPGDDAALACVLSGLISTPLERARPLWQIEEELNAWVALVRCKMNPGAPDNEEEKGRP